MRLKDVREGDRLFFTESQGANARPELRGEEVVVLETDVVVDTTGTLGHPRHIYGARVTFVGANHVERLARAGQLHPYQEVIEKRQLLEAAQRREIEKEMQRERELKEVRDVLRGTRLHPDYRNGGDGYHIPWLDLVAVASTVRDLRKRVEELEEERDNLKEEVRDLDEAIAQWRTG